MQIVKKILNALCISKKKLNTLFWQRLNLDKKQDEFESRNSMNLNFHLFKTILKIKIYVRLSSEQRILERERKVMVLHQILTKFLRSTSL